MKKMDSLKLDLQKENKGILGYHSTPNSQACFFMLGE